MIQTSRIKSQLDIEKPYDSIINSNEFNSNIKNIISISSDTQIIKQPIRDDNFDTFIEKRNRKSN